MSMLNTTMRSNRCCFCSSIRPSVLLGRGIPPPNRSASILRAEGRCEGIERCVWIAARPGFHADHSLIAQRFQSSSDRFVADLARARLAAPRNVGDLDLADPRQRLSHELDQITLTDL